MISKKSLDNILFIDIETVPIFYNYNDLSDEGKQLWDLKAQSLSKFYNSEHEVIDPVKMYHNKAGIFAEFAKVVCISIGYLRLGQKCTLRMKSFAGKDEKKILKDFTEVMDKHFDNPKKDYLCGHNIKEFDIPFLCRRMVVNDIAFPELFDISSKKPWEVNYLLDTIQMWKYGDYKNYTSLRLLAYALGIPSPKDDIDGSQVARVFYEEDDLNKITRYCEKDVLTTVNVFLKLAGFDLGELETEVVE
jgi:predicted PolB exonuclease-like 3'-5' exonuclease